MIFKPVVHSEQAMNYLMLRLALSPNGLNVLPLEPRHLGVPSGASKMISNPMVR
jgi:hypothetical protein